MINIFFINNSSDVSIGWQIIERRKENEKADCFSINGIIARRM
jgi:hypothetical protein